MSNAFVETDFAGLLTLAEAFAGVGLTYCIAGNDAILMGSPVAMARAGTNTLWVWHPAKAYQASVAPDPQRFTRSQG